MLCPSNQRKSNLSMCLILRPKTSNRCSNSGYASTIYGGLFSRPEHNIEKMKLLVERMEIESRENTSQLPIYDL